MNGQVHVSHIGVSGCRRDNASETFVINQRAHHPGKRNAGQIGGDEFLQLVIEFLLLVFINDGRRLISGLVTSGLL